VVGEAFDNICRRRQLKAAYISGDSFHRFGRKQMKAAIAAAAAEGYANRSHFGPRANLFERQRDLYKSYGESATGEIRHYIHNSANVEQFSARDTRPGEFTPWTQIEPGSDMLLYEGLHGWVKTDDDINLSDLVDLRIGVVPVVNLEWIQKVHRDTHVRGYSTEAVVDTIMRRLPEYTRYVVPQFRRSDINFQRVPMVDTSNPLIARDVPTDDETLVVIRFRRPSEWDVDFPFLLRNLKNSWMTRRNSIAVPGAKLAFAMELVLTPIIDRIMANRSR